MPDESEKSSSESEQSSDSSSSSSSSRSPSPSSRRVTSSSLRRSSLPSQRTRSLSPNFYYLRSMCDGFECEKCDKHRSRFNDSRRRARSADISARRRSFQYAESGEDEDSCHSSPLVIEIKRTSRRETPSPFRDRSRGSRRGRQALSNQNRESSSTRSRSPILRQERDSSANRRTTDTNRSNASGSFYRGFSLDGPSILKSPQKNRDSRGEPNEQNSTNSSRRRTSSPLFSPSHRSRSTEREKGERPAKKRDSSLPTTYKEQSRYNNFSTSFFTPKKSSSSHPRNEHSERPDAPVDGANTRVGSSRNRSNSSSSLGNLNPVPNEDVPSGTSNHLPSEIQGHVGNYTTSLLRRFLQPDVVDRLIENDRMLRSMLSSGLRISSLISLTPRENVTPRLKRPFTIRTWRVVAVQQKDEWMAFVYYTMIASADAKDEEMKILMETHPYKIPLKATKSALDKKFEKRLGIVIVQEEKNFILVTRVANVKKNEVNSYLESSHRQSYDHICKVSLDNEEDPVSLHLHLVHALKENSTLSRWKDMVIFGLGVVPDINFQKASMEAWEDTVFDGHIDMSEGVFEKENVVYVYREVANKDTVWKAGPEPTSEWMEWCRAIYDTNTRMGDAQGHLLPLEEFSEHQRTLGHNFKHIPFLLPNAPKDDRQQGQQPAVHRNPAPTPAAAAPLAVEYSIGPAQPNLPANIVNVPVHAYPLSSNLQNPQVQAPENLQMRVSQDPLPDLNPSSIERILDPEGAPSVQAVQPQPLYFPPQAQGNQIFLQQNQGGNQPLPPPSPQNIQGNQNQRQPSPRRSQIVTPFDNYSAGECKQVHSNRPPTILAPRPGAPQQRPQAPPPQHQPQAPLQQRPPPQMSQMQQWSQQPQQPQQRPQPQATPQQRPQQPQMIPQQQSQPPSQQQPNPSGNDSLEGRRGNEEESFGKSSPRTATPQLVPVVVTKAEKSKKNTSSKGESKTASKTMKKLKSGKGISRKSEKSKKSETKESSAKNEKKAAGTTIVAKVPSQKSGVAVSQIQTQPANGIVINSPLEEPKIQALLITNAGPSPVAFWMKTTRPSHFESNPISGILEPQQSRRCIVSFAGFVPGEGPKESDRLTLLWKEVEPGTTFKKDLFSEDGIHTKKVLPIKYNE